MNVSLCLSLNERKVPTFKINKNALGPTVSLGRTWSLWWPGASGRPSAARQQSGAAVSLRRTAHHSARPCRTCRCPPGSGRSEQSPAESPEAWTQTRCGPHTHALCTLSHTLSLTHTHTHTHTGELSHAYRRAHTHTHTHTHTYINTHTYALMHTHKHTRASCSPAGKGSSWAWRRGGQQRLGDRRWTWCGWSAAAVRGWCGWPWHCGSVPSCPAAAAAPPAPDAAVGAGHSTTPTLSPAASSWSDSCTETRRTSNWHLHENEKVAVVMEVWLMVAAKPAAVQP